MQIDAGDADFGEIELVGAVVVAAIGEVVGGGDAVLPAGDAFDELVEAGFAEADDVHVARGADDVDAVDVDDGGHVPRGQGWMLCEKLRAKEALLFGGDGGKQDGAGGMLWKGGAGASDCQEGGGAGGVIDRAVVDV